MNKKSRDAVESDLIFGLSKCTNAQRILFMRMYSYNNLTASISSIINGLPDSVLAHAVRQVKSTIKINDSKGVGNMSTATGYKPMGNRNVKYTQKNPDEIIRCVDRNTGKYILVKKYVFRGRRPDRIDVEDCKLDQPAEYIFDGSVNPVSPDPDYNIKLINYCLDNGNINEYEIRRLVMVYLKDKRKATDKNVFKSACDVFDKADKMLSRCDRRKNNNMHEADVSYKFLIKSYKKIMSIIEIDLIKKKQKSDVVIDFNEIVNIHSIGANIGANNAVNHKMAVEYAYEKMVKQMMKNSQLSYNQWKTSF